MTVVIRLGLCCIFKNEPISFRRTTARYLFSIPPKKRRKYLSDLCLHNAGMLLKALEFCRSNAIMCFRVNSRILPLKTHPKAGYRLSDLPEGERIRDLFKQCGGFSRRNGMRLSFHPDQFILLNSPSNDVTRRSIDELRYQAEVADLVCADVINIHGGGAYGDKMQSLERLQRRIEALPAEVRSRLTLENDDRTYTPQDLLPLCRSTGTPLVYDVHHHRCLADGLSTEAATRQAVATWDREPLFHLSSPRQGWGRGDERRHHDYIRPADVPECWRDLDITVEVEAKAKERAVIRLGKRLVQNGWPVLTAHDRARNAKSGQ